MTSSVTSTPVRVTVTQFNAMTASELVDQLSGLFASRALATAVADARPVASVDALCDTASVLLHDQDADTVLESVNAHPPIGGAVESGSRSAEEQATAADNQGENGEMVSIRNLQPTYREKFGWNFLIRAAGRDSRQILDNLVERIAHDPEDEWPVVIRHLDAINQLRLRGFLVDDGEVPV
jgi:2-oxo-4-hydroxy-4-carboxy-5-ureidoimidazoline decarboxylase